MVDVKEIIKNFNVYGNVKDIEQIFAGHINITFKIVMDNDKKYIVQRMNKYIFKKPYELMENIINVTTFIRDKYIKKHINPDKYVLDFVKTNDGKYCFIDSEDEYWRCYNYIDAVTYYTSSDLKIIEEAGKAFGEFQNQLSDFDASALFTSIENFHNTIDRYEKFRNAMDKDVKGRLDSIKDTVDEFLKLEPYAIKMTEMLNNNELPLRVTHNDTKCNNVLMDESTNEALAVIDLDTIMPGLTGFDFGDSIRSGAANAKEDETDLSLVYCDINKFKAYAKGFLSKTKDSLTENEVKTLALGAFNMTIECGVRFLTDYLEGDVYFHTEYENHNLVRAINQLTMAKDILNKMDELNEIIFELYF